MQRAEVSGGPDAKPDRADTLGFQASQDRTNVMGTPRRRKMSIVLGHNSLSQNTATSGRQWDRKRRIDPWVSTGAS